MSKNRHIELEKIKDQLKRQKDNVVKAISTIQDSIGIGAEIINELNKYGEKQSFLYEMYENVPEAEVQCMSDEKYALFKIPLNSMVFSGEAVMTIGENLDSSRRQWDNNYDVCASLNTIASSAATSAACIAIQESNWFPDVERIAKEYKIVDEINNHIEDIKNELRAEFPHIFSDFDAFLRKFRSSPVNDAQYQDLIGLRSTFYFKMIFDYVEIRYGLGKSRKKEIEIFIFGASPLLASAEPLIKECHAIYSELSDQDPSGNSVKLGKVTVNYIDAMFRRMIANMAAILLLRRKYFKP